MFQTRATLRRYSRWKSFLRFFVWQYQFDGNEVDRTLAMTDYILNCLGWWMAGENYKHKHTPKHLCILLIVLRFKMSWKTRQPQSIFQTNKIVSDGAFSACIQQRTNTYSSNSISTMMRITKILSQRCAQIAYINIAFKPVNHLSKLFYGILTWKVNFKIFIWAKKMQASERRR